MSIYVVNFFFYFIQKYAVLTLATKIFINQRILKLLLPTVEKSYKSYTMVVSATSLIALSINF